jgi:hypothetical protein
MSNPFENLPACLQPYIVMEALNQPIPALTGPFRLTGPEEGLLEADLVFQWSPSTAIVFDGACSVPSVQVDLDQEWRIEPTEANAEVPVLVTKTSFGESPVQCRGLVNGEMTLGSKPFDTLRFSLPDFPDYIGAPCRLGEGVTAGFTRGRIQVENEDGVLILDEIREVKELAKEARAGRGSVLTHVGQWIPASGSMTPAEAEEVLSMLRLWFAFLRGAWSGLLFPQGLTQEEVTWRQLAPWIVSPSKDVPTWMPTRTPLDLAALFKGFSKRWGEDAWRSPLTTAIWWLVEANAPETRVHTRVILAQVALELLAWVHVVETQHLHSRHDFRRLTAAGRLRALLQVCGIPLDVPDYMDALSPVVDQDAFDGPGVVTRIRNALVHAGEARSDVLGALDGAGRWQASQLALQYVDLVLLAVCRHDGHYARRGWRGWKGDDEILVPWAVPVSSSNP